MNTNTLKKKLHLTENSEKKISDTVLEAEQKTTGEIVVAITPESETYSFYELFFSLIVGIVVFAFLIIFSSPIINWLETKFWEMPVWVFTVVVGSISFLVIAIVFFISNIVAIDRKIIPRSVQFKAVTKRAVRTFAECGVHATENQTGILIFISYLEKEVEILADKGIAAKIEQNKWDEIAGTLAMEISSGIKLGKISTEDAICNAVKKCGELLTENFPNTKEYNNEIANGLIFLEGNE